MRQSDGSQENEVSQFTLLASTRKGNKPDFHAAAKPEIAKEMYDCFVRKIKGFYSPEKVKDGVFQAMMEVALVNDGPVRPFIHLRNTGVINKSA